MLNSAVGKKKSKDKSMPLIECFCGAKILLVPDVKKMGEAIEAHAKEHVANLMTKEEKKAEAERVRNYLIAKVLGKV